MRFFEFNTIKPRKPLTSSQTRIYALKRNVDTAKQALERERDFQQRQKVNMKIQKLAAPKIDV